MTEYEVTICFEKPPTFNTRVRAYTALAAKDKAKKAARDSGFCERIKKTTAKKVEPTT